MIVCSVSLIYFSPTGTTLKVCKSIIQGLQLELVQSINLTKPQNRKKEIALLEGDVVVLGMPVYEERIPLLIQPIIEQLKGLGKLVVLVALYGNVGEGIVLKELNRISTANGFKVVGAASFIGQHSFSNKEIQVAKGRPDTQDLLIAQQFGQKIKKKIVGLSHLSKVTDLSISGSLPLMARVLPLNSSQMFTRTPDVITEKCTQCEACVLKCPSGAIDKQTLKIDEKKCLRCFACVGVCQPQARNVMYKKNILVTFFLKRVNRHQKAPVLYV